MNEVIKSIEAVERVLDDGTFEGYEIQTDKQKILILISSSQNCCENWGYFSTPDDVDDYVGATLTDVQVVDTALDTKRFDEILEYGVDGGGCMFVNFITDRGTIQFTVYNAQNGYYGHEIKLMSDQGIKVETTI